jgi:ribosomal protein S18 acetylase RimI-like enzyme
MDDYKITPAIDALDEARKILLEYVDTEYVHMLGVNLEFQHIEDELQHPEMFYPFESGGLYLIYWQNDLAGCVAFRRMDEKSCEIKRLYVRKQFRGHKLGEKALEYVLEEARNKQYQIAYCDTLASKNTAVKLYKAMGFIEIEPYYMNPLADVIYLRKVL